MKPLVEAYSYAGIDCKQLQSQCLVAKNMFVSHLPGTSCRDVCKALFDMKAAFPDLLRFAQLCLTLPLSSACAERSFSAMKRVKTYLRTTMCHDRLSSLCLLSIERTLSSKLLEDPTELVDAFTQQSTRRLLLN